MNTNPLADDKQTGGISKPITIISVTALHIINSNAVNVGEGHKRGSESLLFSTFPGLPLCDAGVGHWLEPMMNVTYSNSRNWLSDPWESDIVQWKFPFSMPISCTVRALERSICQYWQWGRKRLTSLRVATSLQKKTPNIHSHSGRLLYKQISAKPRNSILNPSFDWWWDSNPLTCPPI